MTSPEVEIVLNTYKEDKAYRRDDSEPYERSKDIIIFRQNSLKWHIMVTFRGRNGIKTWKQKKARKAALEQLIYLIDFSCLPLLGDTVTELVVERPWFFPLFQRLPMKSTDSLVRNVTNSSGPTPSAKMTRVYVILLMSLMSDYLWLLSQMSEWKQRSSTMSFSYLGNASLISIRLSTAFSMIPAVPRYSKQRSTIYGYFAALRILHS